LWQARAGDRRRTYPSNRDPIEILLGDRVAVMGGRPPGIRTVIDVPLARPRHALDTDTEGFLTIKRSIRAALNGR
jgi:ABC-type nitrate/sulfonate/bicarbonate transport system ATPase subunit